MKQRYIAIGAIFSGLIIGLTSLSYIIPGIELLFIFFLPFFSSYISFEFGFKKSIPFLFATLLLASIISYITSLLYVFPSLISGLVFGYLARRINKIFDLTFIMSFVEAGLFALAMLVISILFGTKIEEDLVILLKINIDSFNNNKYLFLFLIGLTQASFSSIIISYNYQKLNLKKFNYNSGILILIINTLSIFTMLVFKKNISVLRLSYGIYIVTLLVQTISSFNIKLKYNWIFSVIQIITFLFISIPLLTIISDELKLFVYSWFLLPLVIKNCFQVFKFSK